MIVLRKPVSLYMSMHNFWSHEYSMLIRRLVMNEICLIFARSKNSIARPQYDFCATRDNDDEKKINHRRQIQFQPYGCLLVGFIVISTSRTTRHWWEWEIILAIRARVNSKMHVVEFFQRCCLFLIFFHLCWKKKRRRSETWTNKL